MRNAIGLLLALLPAAAGQSPARITVARELVRGRFGGAGFHAEMFLDATTKEHFEQVLAKRWRELNPSFARVFRRAPSEGRAKAEDSQARQLLFMKEATGTEVYMTTGGARDTAEGDERRAYARAIAGDLEGLLKAGATNLKYFCFTNELTLNAWGALNKDLPKFRSYHQYIYDEIKERDLPIQLLATDASPASNWGTLQWASENMDGITGVYGGHHYINEHEPDNLEFYGWFLEQCKRAVGIAGARGKDFILGEFGPSQYGARKHGVHWDTCRFYGTPLEPLAGLQLAEAAVAAINAGVYAMGYWTFTDYPDRGDGLRINQWGLFKWLANGSVTRAPYYSYGLLTKFFRGPAQIHRVQAADGSLRAAAVRHDGAGTWSIAVVNRSTADTPVAIALEGISAPLVFRKYTYDPRHVPVTEDGDLQEPDGTRTLAAGVLRDTIKAGALAVYTTAYDGEAPAPVKDLAVGDYINDSIPARREKSKLLRWSKNAEADLCYYRIYYNGARIGSTVATEYIDPVRWRAPGGAYTVVAVDQSGNAISIPHAAQLIHGQVVF